MIQIGVVLVAWDCQQFIFVKIAKVKKRIVSFLVTNICAEMRSRHFSEKQFIDTRLLVPKADRILFLLLLLYRNYNIFLPLPSLPRPHKNFKFANPLKPSLLCIKVQMSGTYRKILCNFSSKTGPGWGHVLILSLPAYYQGLFSV